MMKKPSRTLRFETRAEWLKARAGYLTASDAAALYGEHPRKTEYHVFQEKAGGLDPLAFEDASETERVRWGRRLQKPILDGFREEAGVGCAPWAENALMVRDDIRVGASLDAMTTAGEPIEIKTVDTMIFKDQWSREGRLVTEAPLHYEVQVAIQCLLAGSDRGWLVALVGGNDLVWKEVRPPAAMMEGFLRVAADFWRRVDAGEGPEPSGRDIDVVKSLYDSTDMSVVPASTEQEADAERALELKERINELDKERKDILARLLSSMGNAKRMMGLGWSFTRSVIPDKDYPAYTKKGSVRSVLTRKRAGKR